MPKYIVTYRDEITVNIEAANEDEAISKAEKSDNWSFILCEGHRDFFEVGLDEDYTKETLESKINDLYDDIDEIDQHLAYASSSKGLREKSKILSELATLKEELENI
jgi:hypothetical protein